MAGTVTSWRPSTHHALLATTAAGSAGLLLVAPGSADAAVPFTAMALVSLALLIIVERRRSVLTTRGVLSVAAALLLLAVVRPPTASHDIWAYAAYGRTVAHFHTNPYVHSPAAFPHDPIAARVDEGWRHTQSVYGPGFTLASAAVMEIAGHSPLTARLGFQGLAALAVLGAGWLLARSGVSPPALATVLLNPLLVVGVANGGHNDALMGLALLGATIALHRRRPVAAGLWVAAAVSVKAAGALGGVAVLAWVWKRQGLRAALRTSAASALPVTAGYLAFGGPIALRPLLRASKRVSRTTGWRFITLNLPPAEHARVLHHLGVLSLVAVVVVSLSLAAGVWPARSPASLVVAAVSGYLLAGAYVLPWYFAWVLLVAAFDVESPLSRLLFTYSAAVMVAYEARLTIRSDHLEDLLAVGTTAVQLTALAVCVAVVIAAASGAGRRLLSGSSEPVGALP